MKNTGDILILEQFLPYRLNQLSESISLKFALLYKRDFGMTRPEWKTLATLGQHQQLTSTQIGSLTRMHKTKVSRAVHALAKRGWLNRERDIDDRRVEFLRLTPKGLKNYAKLIELACGFENELISHLDETAYATVQEALLVLEKLDI